MGLLEAGSTVGVIFGAQSWPRIPTLNGGPAFAQSAAAIKEYLSSRDGFGLDPIDDILDLFDSNLTASDQLEALSDFLRGWIEKRGGDSTLLRGLFIYYVGHGDFLEVSSEFFMLVKGSTPRNRLSCLLASAIAGCLREEAPFVRQVVLLDCCFSGAAHRQWMKSNVSAYAASQTAKEMPDNGTVLLCSSAETMPSMVPDGSNITMFTGSLLYALKEGSSDIIGDITARNARDLAFEYMKRQPQWRKHAVKPVVHVVDRGSGDLSDFPLFRNIQITRLGNTDEVDKHSVDVPQKTFLQNIIGLLTRKRTRPIIIVTLVAIALVVIWGILQLIPVPPPPSYSRFDWNILRQGNDVTCRLGSKDVGSPWDCVANGTCDNGASTTQIEARLIGQCVVRFGVGEVIEGQERRTIAPNWSYSVNGTNITCIVDNKKLQTYSCQGNALCSSVAERNQQKVHDRVHAFCAGQHFRDPDLVRSILANSN